MDFCLEMYIGIMRRSTLIKAWLSCVPGLRSGHVRSVFDGKMSLEGFLRSSLADLIGLGFSTNQAKAILQHRKDHPVEQIADNCNKNKIALIDIDSSEYPILLSKIVDPPLVLYCKGRVEWNKKPLIAVVGTRRVTPYGIKATNFFVRELVELGFIIVSGFMYGVDSHAHVSAIENQGETVGVLGFGFDHMYPASHKALAERMMSTGQSLLTEYPPWQLPSVANFPVRNRIVSGMSLGVLVIEASSKSGSKITARLASEQGREVFAVPGPYDSAFSEGTKELINLGAKLVTNTDDILEELKYKFA